MGQLGTRGGGGDSPQNCRWGCDKKLLVVRVFVVLLSKARQRSDSGSVLYRRNSSCRLHDGFCLLFIVLFFVY